MQVNQTTIDNLLFCLAHVNIYRSLHGSSNVSYSQSMTNSAQIWADISASTNTFKHSTSRDGENLAIIGSRSVSPCMKAVDKWYSEINNYVYDVPGFSATSGHFTQLVWRDTMEIGIGIGISNNGMMYIVMRYRPPGNVYGRYNSNVKPPIIQKISPLPLSKDRPSPPFLIHPSSNRIHPPYPPTIYPPLPNINGNIFELNIKSPIQISCFELSNRFVTDDTIIISIRNCQLIHQGGSGIYYNLEILSSVDAFLFKKFMLDILRFQFSLNTTLTLFYNTSITTNETIQRNYRIKGARSAIKNWLQKL